MSLTTTQLQFQIYGGTSSNQLNWMLKTGNTFKINWKIATQSYKKRKVKTFTVRTVDITL